MKPKIVIVGSSGAKVSMVAVDLADEDALALARRMAEHPREP
jgi:hypothetical protein